MLGFKPPKRHANKFTYIPRYYDPAKEAREQRRAELYGERSEDADREYTPGQYIRTQREARAARRSAEDRGRQRSVWKLVVVVLFLGLFLYLLLPRLADIFFRAGQPATEATENYDNFDRYAPITIVPNDYEE